MVDDEKRDELEECDDESVVVAEDRDFGLGCDGVVVEAASLGREFVIVAAGGACPGIIPPPRSAFRKGALCRMTCSTELLRNTNITTGLDPAA